ncbi:hypothetical protein Bca52824_045075 [Brassica carinata]|uniref:F-box domain-containing protein n=1 Tax=Brassica carinata TaxID=52824 RepID=A0A8X7UR75_BRACI|nr:hypothetical protein Bca52824_045075 [Brassica carinata]
MKTVFDLPEDLVEDEIISRLPIASLRSVRSTCRKWNTLCKNRIFSVKKEQHQKKQFLMMDSRICLMNFDVRKDDGDPSIEQVSVLDQIQISNVFHCDGLLLCFLMDCSRLLVWNPYLGQTRWIEPRNSFQISDRFALGYDHNNLNHKILRISIKNPATSGHFLGFELYDFSSSSWKVFDDVIPDWEIRDHHLHSVSLKGKYHRGRVSVSLSCVREDQLAVMYQHWDARETIEISVTDKIGPDVVSWTKFLKVVTGSFYVHPFSGSFLVDEEKKAAVVFVLERVDACWYQTAHVIGQDGYFKSVRIREAPDLENIFYPHFEIHSATGVLFIFSKLSANQSN